MAETAIISKSDILNYWPQLDANFKDAKIDIFVLRSQQSKLKPLLGEALYFDFVTNISNSEYQDLLNGVDYTYQGNTIFFGGVKPLLAAYTYSFIIPEVVVNTGRGNVVGKTEEQSEPHTNDKIRTAQREVYSEALRLQDEVVRYLENNTDTYTLYGKKLSYAQDNDTSIRITRVPRHRQR